MEHPGGMELRRTLQALGAAGGHWGALTALPVAVAHLQVPAGACWVLAGAFRATDVLDLLAEALQGGVHLQIAVAHHVGVVSSVVAAAVVSFLLGWLRQEAEVEAAAGGAGRTWGARRAGGTLRVEEEEGERGVKAADPGGEVAAMGWVRTTGPTSPVRPRGPGGPMGPGSPLRPSLPAAPAEPGGPYGRGEVVSTGGTPTLCVPLVSPRCSALDGCLYWALTRGPAGPEAPEGPCSPGAPCAKRGTRESPVSMSGCGAGPTAAIPTPGGTYRRTRWALETGEASVALHASVTLFTGFTFVTTRTLGTLWEEMG